MNPLPLRSDGDGLGLRRLVVPTSIGEIVVHAGRDVFASEADAGAFFAVIRDFEEVRLRDAGHFANLERPDAVLTAIAATARIRLGVTARRDLARRGI